MITPHNQARVDANRLNAQHSTGPRTEAGKARSSQNAIRSGWFARDLRVAEDKIELYLAFEEAWTAELQPEGILELEAFSDFLRNAWLKREVIDAQNEANSSLSSAAAFLHDAGARRFDRLHRYLRDFERRAHQALRELRRLQTERALRAQFPAESAPPPPLAAVKPLLPPKRTHSPVLDLLPPDLLLNLHVMEIETNHLNARIRAHQAGLHASAAAGLG